RAAAGACGLHEPGQLLKLRVAMAKNKLRLQVRRAKAQRRDIRRGAAITDEQALPGTTGTPSRQVAARELLQEVHKRLSADELQLVAWRNDGVEWGEIAVRLSGSAEALRKKLARALDRVAAQLGLDEAGHD